jgi:drug/metabolite transporter (DMT)-like permease
MVRLMIMFKDNSRQILELLRSGNQVEIGGAERQDRLSTRRSGHRESLAGGRIPSSASNGTFGVVLGFAAIYLIWGSTYLGIRYAVETIPPLLMMGVRHTVAGLLVYVWARRRGTTAPTRKQWGYAAVAGLLLFLGGHGTLAWAEQRVASGLAALLCATLPLWTVLISRVDGSERKLGAKAWAGLVLGFAGVALLIGPDALAQHLNLLAAGVVLSSALLWAVGTGYSRRAALPESKILSAAMQMICGGSILLLAGVVAGEAGRVHAANITAKSVLALAYLIVFGSVIAFTVYTWLVSVSSPSMLSTYAYVNPVVAVFLGWSLAGEALGLRTIAAALIILAGVGLVTRARGSAPVKEKAEARMGGEELCEAAGD